jgi:glycosyltransferase involved in cell wall biosynthesis
MDLVSEHSCGCLHLCRATAADRHSMLGGAARKWADAACPDALSWQRHRERGEAAADEPPLRAGRLGLVQLAALLCLTGSFPSARSDPRGAFIAAWTEALAARGHTVRVVAPASPSSAARERWMPGVEVSRHRAYGPVHGHLWHRAGAPENLRSSRRAWLEAPGSLWALGRAARQRGAMAELVWSHWLLPFGLIGRSAARAHGLPHVVQCHGSDLRLLERMPCGGRLARHVGASADHLVFVSSEAQQRFVRLLGRRATLPPCEVLPVGVEPPPADCAAPPPEPGAPWRLLVLSRLNHAKGIDLLLRALPGLPVELTVVGDGPERAALAALARQLGLSASFPGACAPSERWAALGRAHLLIVPSRGEAREGAPVVIGEVLAAQSGGIAETLGPHGVMVPPDDVGALREALVRLLDEPARWTALARSGRAAAQQRLWPALAARYDAVVRSVLLRAPPREPGTEGPRAAGAPSPR